MSGHVKSPEVFNKSSGVVTVESLADILERELSSLIEAWLIRVEKEPDLVRISLNHDERTGHLPHLIHDVTTVRLKVEENQLVDVFGKIVFRIDSLKRA